MELLARVDAIRRRLRIGTTRRVSDAVPIQVGRVRIDPSTRTVHAADQPVSLRPKEFDLLLALARRGGGIASRDELLEEVWGYDADVVSRTVDTHIGQLRSKLEPDPHAPRLILTVRKTGYRLHTDRG
jgi:DNA-binding response OmpR family regulator